MLIQEYNPFLNRHPPRHTKAVRLIQARISFLLLEECFGFGTIAVWASSVMYDLRIIVFQNKPNYFIFFSLARILFVTCWQSTGCSKRQNCTVSDESHDDSLIYFFPLSSSYRNSQAIVEDPISEQYKKSPAHFDFVASIGSTFPWKIG